jgi:hypothetical protein
MEMGIVIGFGYWGFTMGNGLFSKIILCIIVPAVGFGFWGLVDFHSLGRYAESARLIQELVISGIVAILLYSSGKHFAGILLALISIVHHALVYMLGDRLQKEVHANL